MVTAARFAECFSDNTPLAGKQRRAVAAENCDLLVLVSVARGFPWFLTERRKWELRGTLRVDRGKNQIEVPMEFQSVPLSAEWKFLNLIRMTGAKEYAANGSS